jgi:uncharacterized protein with beta-barrel porin domain
VVRFKWMSSVSLSRRDWVRASLSLPRIHTGNAWLRTTAAVAVFAAGLSVGSDAWAVCATTGTAPATVTVTCSGAVTTTNTNSITSPNPNTTDRGQLFGSSITATVNAGATITGAGLAPTSTLNGSTVSLTNNGSITSNVNAAAAVEGSGSNFTLSYTGSGNITGSGTAGALQLLGAGTGTSTATVSATSTLTTAVSGGLFVAPGIQTGGTSGTVNVTVLSGGTVQGSNAIQFDGTGSNTLTNSGSVGSVAAGTLTTNGVSANIPSNNSIAVINHATGTIAGSITGILAGASGSVAITNDTGGHITASNTTSAAGATASVGVSAGSVTGSNAGIISGSTHGIDTTGSLPSSTGPGTSVNLTSNSGTIQGTATVASGFTVGSGIKAETSVTVGTNSGIISGGLNGITTINSFVTVTSNTGTISGLSGSGILAANGNANVTNATGGQITGVTSGITAGSITVTNSGTVSATTGSGIAATSGALSVTNNAGTISGGAIGVNSGGASATVINSALITGANTGINLATGTSDITNNLGATISGTGASGINSGSATVNLANSGTVTGNNSGINSGGDVNVTSNTGAITGVVSGIVTSGTANVTNNTGGQITGGSGGGGISAATITVSNAGTISGGTAGALTLSSVGSITVTSNTGSISSTNPVTATITGSNVNVTNGASGSITATGANSIAILSGSLNITNNAGALISGANDGVNQQAGGTATIANTGTISGAGRSGLRLGNNASVTNTGTGLITGLTGIAFRDPTATNTPVVNGSVFNSGTITGTGGTAINFALTPGSGPFTLTLGPGSVINGTALGTGGDRFQLGGTTGSDTFNVSNIGAAQQYRGFTTFNKISGSTWLLTGTGAQTWNASGGVLGGTATVGGLNVLSGGTFMPGNGTAGTSMSVTGNLAFQSGAQYLVQLNPAIASFTSVTGTAMPGGATVDANFAAGTYVSKQYTILTATGGVSGTFGALVNTNLPANFHTSLSYDAHDVFLNLALNFAVPGGLNGNQQNVANAISNFFNSTGSIPLFFTALTPAGLTQAAGETATGTQQTTFDAMTQFLGLLIDPFIADRGDGAAGGGGAIPFAEEDDGANAYAAKDKPRSKSERDAYAAIYRKAPVMADPFAQRWSVWAAGYGGSQTTDGNAVLGSNTATSRVFGTAVGADYRFSPFTLAGFALAGGGTNFSIANALGTGRSDLFQAGAFVRHTVGPAYIAAALAYGWQDVTTDRTVTIAGLDQLRAKFNANAFSGRVEGGYRFVTPWMGVTPYAAGQFTTFDLPAYAEQAIVGANTFALAYGAKSVTASRSELGLRSDKSYAVGDAILTLRGRFAWAHDFNADRNIAATFQTLPGASFVVNGAAQAHDAALTTASTEMKFISGFSLAATFEGEFSNVTRSYAGKGVVRYAW